MTHCVIIYPIITNTIIRMQSHHVSDILVLITHHAVVSRAKMEDVYRVHINVMERMIVVTTVMKRDAVSDFLYLCSNFTPEHAL